MQNSFLCNFSSKCGLTIIFQVQREIVKVSGQGLLGSQSVILYTSSDIENL